MRRVLHAGRRAARRLGVERPALAVRRRLLPAHVRADVREHELLVALMARTLAADSCCLDVGAHQGAVLAEMVRLAPRGRHVAWEPLPELAAGLRARFASVEVREAALSDRPGEREFVRVPGALGWSGFRARPAPTGSGPDAVERLRVRVERLDDALAGDLVPALIKIDVEGAELEVLAGALATLRRARPLVAFEHGAGSADHYGTAPDDVHDLLAGELGYAIEGLDGDGPYDRARFGAIFRRGERVNFLARPRATR